jgi:hypothetical protein
MVNVNFESIRTAKLPLGFNSHILETIVTCPQITGAQVVIHETVKLVPGIRQRVEPTPLIASRVIVIIS